MSRRIIARLAAAALAAALLLFPTASPHRASAASFTVTSPADTPDLVNADGLCLDVTGQCSLRAAIEQANFNASPTTISFAIPGSGVQTITLLSALPAVTVPVAIDATTQAGFSGTPIVVLDGVSAGSGVDGLQLTAGNSSVRGLVVERFSGNGITLMTNGANTIAGNYIGIDADGVTARGNGASGVDVNNVGNNTVGGTGAADRNVISGNGGDGVLIEGTSAGSNQISGNYVGVDAAGVMRVPNSGDGIGIEDAPSNMIGGTTAGARNLLSGNNGAGIYIHGAGASGTVIRANYIGIDATGTASLHNRFGIHLYFSSGGHVVGGPAADDRNVISGNSQDGITFQFESFGAGTLPDLVEGNFIGTNAAGNAAIPNHYGISGLSARPATIRGNVVSGNTLDGLAVTLVDSVTSNFVGVQADGVSALGNGGNGVSINNNSRQSIGTTTTGEGNVIAFNGAAGVWLQYSGGSTGRQISIRGNSIFSNGALGIDLATPGSPISPPGVTPNDPGDGDTGPNDLQNFPVLSVASSGGSTTVNGSLNSTANTTFDIDMYANPSCDPSGYGEGKTYLGSTTVTTDASGSGGFTSVFAGLQTYVTATATDPSGNTSEFSQCATADSDGDGCPDARELGADHKTGGQRDPNDFWDFFDVPTPPLVPSNTTGTRNHAISIGDAIGILAYIGTNNANPNQANSQGATYGSDWNNNGIADGQEYDRTPGAQAWAPGPPNGAVTIGDALIAVNGIGDNCN